MRACPAAHRRTGHGHDRAGAHDQGPGRRTAQGNGHGCGAHGNDRGPGHTTGHANGRGPGHTTGHGNDRRHGHTTEGAGT